jgi:hypothetical protein
LLKIKANGLPQAGRLLYSPEDHNLVGMTQHLLTKNLQQIPLLLCFD